ncbi:MAG: hypothetical protein DMG65_10930 [Candidatus Angelobacter sp. Gp1-AA117]|nr:MAG: hypothetical protein DMG65_10930 [Candidatus Angelobacter sp. Gp1-AA117]
MALVLCTGADPALMETRRMLLEKSGHRVITATDEAALKAACQQNAFNVAVIGQVLPISVKKRLLVLIRAHCPAAKVLELYAPSTGRILKDADSWLEVPADVPETLPQEVTALASH